MFFSLQALLLHNSLTAKSHSGMLTVLYRAFIKKGKLPDSLGKEFARAQQKRYISDYGYTPQLTKEETVELLGSAKWFVEVLQNHLIRK